MTSAAGNTVWFTVDIGRDPQTFSFDLNDLWGDESDFIEDLTGLSVHEWYIRMGSPHTRRDRDKLILVFLAMTRRLVAIAGRSTLVYTDFRTSVNVRSFVFLDGPPADETSDGEETAGTDGDEDQAAEDDAEPEPDPAPAPPRRPAAKRSPATPRASRAKAKTPST